MAKNTTNEGVSLAPHAIRGTVTGKNWLGFEVNGWSALLCAGTGLALLFAAPRHWAPSPSAWSSR